MAARSNINSQTFSLLNQLTRSFDFLPQDLTKAFGDLRELDAVLRANVQSVTQKIYKLIELMQNPNETPEARFRLLIEIAEEAARLRAGSDDKIRLTSTTADEIIARNSYNQQIFALLASIDPSFEDAQFVRRTNYPHVAPSNLLPPTGDAALYLNGRRKRIPTHNAATYVNGAQASRGGTGPISGGAANSGLGDKNKKRRLEDDEPGARRTPKGKEKDRAAAEKEAEAEAQKDRDRHRNKKARTGQRSPSPTDDRLQSGRSSQVPSRQPVHRSLDQYGQAQQPPPQPYPGQTSNGYAQPTSSHHPKQRHDHAQHRDYPPMPHQPPYSSNGHTQLPLPHHLQGSHRSKPVGGTSSLLDVVADRTANGAPAPYGGSRHAFDEDDYDMVNRQHGRDRDGPRAKETYSGGSRNGPGEGTGTGEEGDGDTRTYCYCERVSFGEMIGCDDPHCSREWFHLTCLNIAAPPRGEWFCNECRIRREKEAKGSKKPNRNRARVPNSTSSAANGHSAAPNGTSSRASVPPPPRSSNPRGA